MRLRAAALGLVLAACLSPAGVEPPRCDEEAEDAPPVIAEPSSAAVEPVPIDCWRPDGRRRILLGFTLPPGPDCWALSRVEVVESGAAVSVRLLIAPVDDPLTGACAPDGRQVRTEVDLQSPLFDRIVLDGSREGGE